MTSTNSAVGLRGGGKIRLLAVSDWADTGFGRVLKELLPRLVATGLFEVEVVGWHWDGDADEYDRALDQGVRLHPAHYNDPWGKHKLGKRIQEMKADVVLSLGDPWMIEWINQYEFRGNFRWVAYVPIDRDVIPYTWQVTLSQPDLLVLYSQFGKEVVDRQVPYRNPEMIYHGVDAEAFHPLSDAERTMARKTMNFDEDQFIIGMVARNQERKQVPRAFAGFKAFTCEVPHSDEGEREQLCVQERKWRCDGCPHFRPDPAKESSKLYLHMTMGDGKDPDDGRGIGWRIQELVTRYGVQQQIAATRGYQVRKGLSTDHLNVVYNLFDVHLMTTKREGFGLPVLEAMAAGVPNAVTNYSAVVELIEQGGGELIDVLTFVNDPSDEAESALVDVGSVADTLHRLWKDPELRARHAKTGRAFAESLTWDSTVPAWVEAFHRVLGRPVPEDWHGPGRPAQPKEEAVASP